MGPAASVTALLATAGGTASAALSDSGCSEACILQALEVRQQSRPELDTPVEPPDGGTYRETSSPLIHEHLGRRSQS